jgi:hypothetical protein
MTLQKIIRSRTTWCTLFSHGISALNNIFRIRHYGWFGIVNLGIGWTVHKWADQYSGWEDLYSWIRNAYCCMFTGVAFLVLAFFRRIGRSIEKRCTWGLLSALAAFLDLFEYSSARRRKFRLWFFVLGMFKFRSRCIILYFHVRFWFLEMLELHLFVICMVILKSQHQLNIGLFEVYLPIENNDCAIL